jgi:hypothetical protein
MKEVNAVAVQSQAEGITVLTAFSNNTVKRFQLDDSGALMCIPYGQETHFSHKCFSARSIFDLGQLVQQLSGTQNTVLIRGHAVPGLKKPIRRRAENFPEPPQGCAWAMLDFDNLSLPAGMSPISIEAIESAIAKLPAEFQNTSYVFQFSASAGIVKPDGVPLKNGLNVHLFFWFDRPVPGTELSAYLERHCIRTGFYEKTTDRSGAPWIRWGIDPAVIRSAVQPHYVGLPIIDAGVVSSIALDARQGLVKKACDSVIFPVFDKDVRQLALTERKQLLDAYKRECGFVEARLITKAAHGGISVSSYHRKAAGLSPSVNRGFVKAVPYSGDGEVAETFILHFDDENSPGSWYVTKASPQLARRFGDGSSLPLKELSEGAYAYFRDDLRWFTEVTQNDTLSLDANGYLPDIASFVGTVRNALIEAPTGSGKTSAFCRFSQANPNAVILYAAQTRALVWQMYDDLVAVQVPVVHYSDFPKGSYLNAGVYVTTNESLVKFVAAAVEHGSDFILVIDEVHMALEDFMKTEAKNQLLERAIGRAQRSLFMTATITPLQIQKLLDTISRACGALTPAMYGGYKFAPVKSNPLILKPVSELGPDFVALMRKYQALKATGQSIPRTVFITPTSKMRLFEGVLETFGLLDDALVVSRQESTPTEIEEARTSLKPILIASPMFALGLNFVAQPERFWTYFSYLKIDTSQIIQTINRANRGPTQCEVRLYHGALDSRPFRITPEMEERARIEGFLLDESSVQGVIDSHFHVDRPTYTALRHAEKITAKAMAYLVDGDRFQNYRIDRNWQETLVRSANDDQVYKDFKTVARESYLNDIVERAAALEDEPDSMLLHKLELLDQEGRLLDQRTDGRVARDIETDERAIAMLLCDIDDPEDTAKVKPKRLRRLYGETRPYLTPQYNWERTTAWRDAAAEKTRDMVPLLVALKSMRAGQMDGNQFASNMRRPGLRASVTALADSEANYLYVWQPKLTTLDQWVEESRTKASTAKRSELKRKQFAIANEFLNTIGVRFDHVKTDGKWRLDPTKPLVPDWDFDSMILNLERAAVSLKDMPDQPINRHEVEEAWAGPPVKQVICKECVHCESNWFCAKGRPIQWMEDEESAATDQCDAFKRLPARLMRMLPTENENSVGLTSATLPLPIAVLPSLDFL